MNEVMVIFSLAAAGCLVRLSTDLALRVLGQRVSTGSLANGPNPASPHESRSNADPVVALGLTLTCYGTIALALVSELPGAFAFQRTGLVFALLCVGGLVGEISRTGTSTAAPDVDAEEREPAERTPTSVGLSVALMLVLNLAIAVLAAGQGLIHIVPPPAPTAGGGTELEQIVVVAKRASSRTSDSSSFL